MSVQSSSLKADQFPDDAGSSSGGGFRGFLGDVGPKLFITIVAAGITALLIPWINGQWQDHKEQLELRTSLATDMSRAYTDVITSERFVALGYVYSAGNKAQRVATNVNAWQTAWRNWLVEAGTLGAQLTARYGQTGIAADWKTYTDRVADYVRLAGETPTAADRQELINKMTGYVTKYLGTEAASAVNWSGLIETAVTKAPKTYKGFTSSYTQLGDQLLLRGDAIVGEELHGTPNV